LNCHLQNSLDPNENLLSSGPLCCCPKLH
jgi:hypothetical protein